MRKKFTFQCCGDVVAVAGCNEGLIENCHNRNVNVKGVCAGGIAGDSSYIIRGDIINCSSTGNVEGFTAGGIAGNGGRIINSCNIGNISSEGDYAGGRYGNYAGGIAGYGGAMIQNCYNAGIITKADFTGGIGGIAGCVKQGIIANSFCSEESAEVNIYSMDGKGKEKNNKALPDSEMRTDSFMSRLNTNRGDNADWLEWEIRPEESPYPLPVKRVNLSQCQISLDSSSMTYDGTEKCPGVIVVYNGETPANDVDYTLTYGNNINVGNAMVEIEGIGRCMGSVTLPFSILSTDISQCDITFDTEVLVYDGSAKKLKVTVAHGNRTLTEGVDYTVAYKDNVNAGTAKVTVSGKGNYTGTADKTFTIKKAHQEFGSHAKSHSKAYGDKPFKLGVGLKSGNGKLTYESSDGKVAAVDSKGKVTIKGTGVASITVKAAGTDNYNAASTKVTVKASPAK